VQLSVFECLRFQAEAQALRADLLRLIAPFEDQVRIYLMTSQTFSERYIIGVRTVEERSDYWIAQWARSKFTQKEYATRQFVVHAVASEF
jgi:CRISPR-associated protein Cas2